MRLNGIYIVESVCGDYIGTYKGQAEVAKAINASQGEVSQLLNGKIKKCKGYTIRKVSNE